MNPIDNLSMLRGQPLSLRSLATAAAGAAAAAATVGAAAGFAAGAAVGAAVGGAAVGGAAVGAGGGALVHAATRPVPIAASAKVRNPRRSRVIESPSVG